MAEIPKIGLAAKIQASEKPEPHQAVKVPAKNSRKCPYVKDMDCTLPDVKMKVCQNCPYAQLYIVKNLFKKIIGQAIFFIKGDRALKDVFRSSPGRDSKDKP